MLNPARVMVLLALEAEGPIRGSISAAAENERLFYGWLELAGALDRARRVGAKHTASGSANVELGGGTPLGNVGATEPM